MYNYFPTGYQPYQYQQSYQQTPQYQQQYTPPTIRAEIIQVGDEQEVQNYPLAAGATQMFMSKDDKCIFIKTAYANSPAKIVRYNREEPKTEPPVEYVTREELDRRLNGIIEKFKVKSDVKKQGDVKNGSVQ